MAEEIGLYLELSTEDMDLRGACAVLEKWYQYTSARAPNPSWVDMAKVAKDYTTLSQREDPDLPS